MSPHWGIIAHCGRVINASCLLDVVPFCPNRSSWVALATSANLLAIGPPLAPMRIKPAWVMRAQ